MYVNFLPRTSHFVVPFFPPLLFGLTIPQTHHPARESIIWYRRSNQVSGCAVLRPHSTLCLSHGEEYNLAVSLPTFSLWHYLAATESTHDGLQILYLGKKRIGEKNKSPRHISFLIICYQLQLLATYFIPGRSPGWKNGGDWVRVGMKRDGKQIQHFDKPDAKMLWSSWSKGGGNTFVRLSALCMGNATLAHHLPLCINATSTCFIHCWTISVQSIFLLQIYSNLLNS